MVYRLIAACYLVARSDINLTHSTGIEFYSKSGKWLFVEFSSWARDKEVVRPPPQRSAVKIANENNGRCVKSS